jgi:hypothetical protein
MDTVTDPPAAKARRGHSRCGEEHKPRRVLAARRFEHSVDQQSAFW